MLAVTKLATPIVSKLVKLAFAYLFRIFIAGEQRHDFYDRVDSDI